MPPQGLRLVGESREWDLEWWIFRAGFVRAEEVECMVRVERRVSSADELRESEGDPVGEASGVRWGEISGDK